MAVLESYRRIPHMQIEETISPFEYAKHDFFPLLRRLVQQTHTYGVPGKMDLGSEFPAFYQYQDAHLIVHAYTKDLPFIVDDNVVGSATGRVIAINNLGVASFYPLKLQHVGFTLDTTPYIKRASARLLRTSNDLLTPTLGSTPSPYDWIEKISHTHIHGKTLLTSALDNFHLRRRKM